MTDIDLMRDIDNPVAMSEPAFDRQKILAYLGLDDTRPEVQALLLIAERYDLDPVVGHLVMIEGSAGRPAKPYITRDGLLHIAHRSGKLDGIVTSEAHDNGTEWKAQCSVYRTDMSHPFVYTGRYPKNAGNVRYAPEMAIKCAESHALRRAFSVAIASVEERWDDNLTPPPMLIPRDTLAELHTRVASLPEDARDTMVNFVRSTGATSKQVTVEQYERIDEKLREAEALEQPWPVIDTDEPAEQSDDDEVD